jgi:hypothetical protein
MSRNARRPWLRIAVVLILLWPPMMVFNGAIDDAVAFKGGWHWESPVYALWEASLCVSMCIGLIYAFRRYLNRRGKVAAVLVPNAYTAYIVHAPVIATLAFAVQGATLYPLLKWTAVGCGRPAVLRAQQPDPQAAVRGPGLVAHALTPGAHLT